ncbi:hypothetical protein RE411_04650 [Agrobacterium pusense]|uniref:hypothetical protein n=1 Tax=Agrobacterium pusense TaxID=648995 RepID=UPI00286831D2|nr:hypothetical protein [Agrobacterium pusense]WMW56478.1 hypothetical protein RE411_04650 [Agrobacterium pusense]
MQKNLARFLSEKAAYEIDRSQDQWELKLFEMTCEFEKLEELYERWKAEGNVVFQQASRETFR